MPPQRLTKPNPPDRRRTAQQQVQHIKDIHRRTLQMRILANRYQKADILQSDLFQEHVALFCTATEVAAVFNVSRTRIYQMIKVGTIPCQRFGQCIRIPRYWVQQFIMQTLDAADNADSTISQQAR